MAYHLYVDEIGQAIVDLVDANLSIDLALKTCQQGTLYGLPAPKNLDAVLNALLVDFRRWHLKIGDLIQGSEVVYEFALQFLRRQPDSEAQPDRERNKLLSKLGALFMNQQWNLSALDGTPGLEILSAVPEEADTDSDAARFFGAEEFRISVAEVKLTVTTTSTP